MSHHRNRTGAVLTLATASAFVISPPLALASSTPTSTATTDPTSSTVVTGATTGASGSVDIETFCELGSQIPEVEAAIDEVANHSDPAATERAMTALVDLVVGMIDVAPPEIGDMNGYAQNTVVINAVLAANGYDFAAAEQDPRWVAAQEIYQRDDHAAIEQNVEDYVTKQC